MPYGYHLEAQYQSGYTLVQDETDVNPYGNGSTFTAIRTDAAVPTNGPLVTLSLVNDATGERHDIDWASLAGLTDVRPVYYRQMERTRDLWTGLDTGPMCNSHHFGYQYIDGSGNNVQEIQGYAPS